MFNSGITVLVTHVERKPLSSLFAALLYKNFSVDARGHKVVKINDLDLKCHKDFALYISTSVPLSLRGDPHLKYYATRTAFTKFVLLNLISSCLRRRHLRCPSSSHEPSRPLHQSRGHHWHFVGWYHECGAPRIWGTEKIYWCRPVAAAVQPGEWTGIISRRVYCCASFRLTPLCSTWPELWLQ